MLSRLDDVAKAISARMTGQKDLGAPHFADKRYAPKPFSSDNFRKILPINADEKIAFIDAGNMEIFASPGLSVHFIRAYFCLFRNNARIIPKNLPVKIEFFSVSSAKEIRGDMQFSCSLIPAGSASKEIISEIGEITLDSGDPTISAAGGFSASISVMGGVARRFTEWLYAAKIIESELSVGDILVRDGALVSSVNGEADFAKKAYDAADKKGAILCACAKTSELLTTTGVPLTSAVQILAEKSKIAAPWFYAPVAENNNPEHRAEIFVANFHEKSRRAFRFEIEKGIAAKLTDEEKKAIFGALASNSCDGPFLGYPYGLIDADANARISTGECANYRMALLSMLRRRGAGDVAELVEGAKDAHEVLNEGAKTFY